MSSEVYDNISRKFYLFSFKQFRAPYRYFKCEAVNFNNKISVFSGCFYGNSSKICVQCRWTKVNKKETVLRYTLYEAEFKKAPKQ